jgi:ribonuclease T1
MGTNINRFFKFFALFLVFFTLISCNNVAQNPSKKQQYKQQQSRNGAVSDSDFGQQASNGAVPAKAYDLLKYIKANGSAPDGYVGGRTFMNREKRLPKTDASGNIKYQEWDVNPKKKGKNRGTERVITGSNSSAYYTGDHYKTFTKFE